MKTYFPKKGDENITHDWYIVDAKDAILGRIASKIADTLRGKNKPIFSPHMDTGDHVIVINAEKIQVTGNKLEQKKYYRHSGYIGNLKEMDLKNMLQKKPEQVITKAVRGMLPKNKLRKVFLKKLKVYTGSEHPHEAQNPKELTM